MSREMDRAWFSCLLRDPARKRSGSIFTTPEPTGALMDWIDCHKTRWNRTSCKTALRNVTDLGIYYWYCGFGPSSGRLDRGWTGSLLTWIKVHGASADVGSRLFLQVGTEVDRASVHFQRITYNLGQRPRRIRQRNVVRSRNTRWRTVADDRLGRYERWRMWQYRHRGGRCRQVRSGQKRSTSYDRGCGGACRQRVGKESDLSRRQGPRISWNKITHSFS